MYSALGGMNARVCRIRNTAELSEMWISESLIEEARKDGSVTVEENPRTLPYDAAGNLL